MSSSPSSSRRRRVPREAISDGGARSHAGLPPDSLAQILLLAARAIAGVRAGKSLTTLLGATLRNEAPAARAAAQDAIYGTLRDFGCGEFILSRLLERTLPHPETEALLLVALYRLRTRPDSPHTVVDQAVVAAGELANGGFKSLVNALLRNYLRQREALHAAMPDSDEATYRHPQWWISRLRRAYPERWREILAAGNTAPPMCLRVNRRRVAVDDYLARLQAAGLSAKYVDGEALLLTRPVGVDSLPGFVDGLVSVQDAGAQRAAHLLGPMSGERIFDACAAPGGKTAHLLETAEIRLLALDVDGKRAQRIEENLQRLGLSAAVEVADCRDTGRWWDGQPFDAILADVPCSASGVVRRHPDSKYLRRESDIRRFSLLQSEILDKLWPLLKIGGRMLYVTCSVFPEENGAQIDAFLCRWTNARLRGKQQLLPLDHHDGFFYALLEKTS